MISNIDLEVIFYYYTLLPEPTFKSLKSQIKPLSEHIYYYNPSTQRI